MSEEGSIGSTNTFCILFIANAVVLFYCHTFFLDRSILEEIYIKHDRKSATKPPKATYKTCPLYLFPYLTVIVFQSVHTVSVQFICYGQNLRARLTKKETSLTMVPRLKVYNTMLLL